MASNPKHGTNYQPFETEAGERPQPPTNFRGFGTGIGEMFTDVERERSDCCAMACCGVIQSDKNRYLVTRVKPPSCIRRVFLHILLPFFIFASATFCAVVIEERYVNEMLSTGMIFLLIIYFILQCYKGSYKRRMVRKEYLWSKSELLATGEFRSRFYEEDSEMNSTQDFRLMLQNPEYLMGQTVDDIRNAHGLCGCYRNDSPRNYREKTHIHFCGEIFSCIQDACCGILCKRRFQLCGICALAQEARDLELVLDPGHLRIDYVTMQPMLDYYPAIYEERHVGNSGVSWWGRLSQFSKELLRSCCLLLMLLFGWSMLADRVRHKFGPLSFLVFCCTLLQSFVLMYFVYLEAQKDVSVDALIKMTVSGFCLSTTFAIFFELILGMTGRFLISSVVNLVGINQIETTEYSMLYQYDGSRNLSLAQITGSDGPSSYRDFLHVYGREHPIFYTFLLLFNAFALAALIEELSKYFGYRMVEHPDFLSKDQLEEAAKHYPRESPPSRKTFPEQNRGAQSRGTAMTVSMVAASLGFACCENLIYIFVYGESNVKSQILVLLIRALLPVHPIAAAIQSVRLCEKEVEEKRGIGLWDVIRPAVLFHGIYDFVLIWIDFMVHKNGNYVDGGDYSLEQSSSVSDVISITLSLLIVFGGWLYYRKQSRLQKWRLKRMDASLSRNSSGLI